jgi:hypothetical protein
MIFGEDDYLIICGHEHKPALFECRDNHLQAILNRGEQDVLKIMGVNLTVTKFERKLGSNYLLRLGIAGSEFALLFEDEKGRRMGFFEIV